MQIQITTLQCYGKRLLQTVTQIICAAFNSAFTVQQGKGRVHRDSSVEGIWYHKTFVNTGIKLNQGSPADFPEVFKKLCLNISVRGTK